MPEQPIDLDAIAKRAYAARAGAWTTTPIERGGLFIESPESRLAGDYPIAEVRDHADAEFIAHARGDIIALLNELHSVRVDRDFTAIENRGLLAELLEVSPGRPVVGVLSAVLAERTRQDARWGAGSADNNPDGTGPHTRPLYAHTATGIADDDEAHYIRDVMQGRVDWRAANDGTADRPLTHADIFLEEVAEALAEDDPAKLRAELVQAAAYAVKWIEAIDRRTAIDGAGEAQ